jgi:hypothetical protein
MTLGYNNSGPVSIKYNDKYQPIIVESSDEKLEKIPLKDIENFLRKKKLNKINGSKG